MRLLSALMILTLAAVATIAILLNTTALESAFAEDIDMNRELRAAGLANVIAGLGGALQAQGRATDVGEALVAVSAR